MNKKKGVTDSYLISLVSKMLTLMSHYVWSWNLYMWFCIRPASCIERTNPLRCLVHRSTIRHCAKAKVLVRLATF